MAAITEEHVTIDGVRSLVRSAGSPDAREAVVFLHGNPGSSEDWLDLLGRVGEFSRAVAPDMPGFGRADRPKDFEYTVPGYAQHLAGLLETLGIERAHLVLHDFGGAWGFGWMLEHQRAIASVTLINVGVLPGYTWHKFARICQTPVLGELFSLIATRFAFGAALNRENPKPFPKDFLDRMYRDNDWGMKRAVLALYRNTRDPGTLSDALAVFLKPLALPALVVWGKGDTFVPCRFAEVQRDIFDVEAVHLLDGCGHWPFIDEPQRVAELIVPFLEKQVSTPPPPTRAN